MKICIISPYFPYYEHIQGMEVENGYHVGGVERHVLYFSYELIKRGHKVSIISIKSPNHHKLSEIDDLEIIRISKGLHFFSSYFPIQILKIVNPNNYDIIHAHTPVPFIADLAIFRNIFTKIPFILTYHNDIIKYGVIGKIITVGYNYTFGKLLLKKSSKIIATTKSYASASPLLKHYLKKVAIIPNGVDCKIFYPIRENSEIKKRLKIPLNKKIILFVGWLDSYKGCDYLLKSFPIIKNEIQESFLIFVGKGPLINTLKKDAQKFQISEDVLFTGYIKEQDLPSYFNIADVFVLPSVSPLEGFGIVQLEAMASGIPVVTTTIPGVCEVDPDEIGSIHVEPENIIALSQAIIQLLKSDELRKKIGDNGRIFCVEKYSYEKLVVKLEKLYYDCQQ